MRTRLWVLEAFNADKCNGITIRCFFTGQSRSAQSVYDEVTDGLTSVDDATVTDIACMLFDAHRSGFRDRA